MRALPVVTVLGLLAAALLAGCSGSKDGAGDRGLPGAGLSPTLPGFTGLPVGDLPVFSAPILVDDVRAGGEPVIAITHAGTLLVSAHPGFTHYHPSSDPTHPGSELLTPVNAQSYMWRSTDGGESWRQVGLPIGETDAGPRSTGFGVSDPEFTVMEDGTICFTDLESLVLASTSCSSDDGVTWLPGNPISSGRPVDRQWLASYHDEFYFNANYLAGFGPVNADFRVSTDKGLTWTDRGVTPCSSDLIANPANGHLYQGCNGDGIGLSTDGGRTWTRSEELGDNFTGGARIMAEPGLDSAGNVWVVGSVDEHTLGIAGTPDEGKTWPWTIDLTPHFALFAKQHGKDTTGTYVWPWISAGSRGRVAVSWIGSYDDTPSNAYDGEWFIFTAFVIGADTASPTVVVTQVTPEPMHVGPICQQGTTCQVSSVTGDPTGDRRLGDFFETTIGSDGYLYGSWSNTHAKPEDVISHPQFARQIGGVRLIADDELGRFMPTQG